MTVGTRLRYLAASVVERSTGDPAPYIGLESIESHTGRLAVDSLPEKEATDSVVFGPGDVLFGKLRPYLAKSLVAREHGTGSGEILVLRPGRDLDPRFLHYVTLSRSWLEWTELNSYGSKMPRASWEELRDFRLPALDVPTQRLIADFLDRETAQIDAMVDAQKRLVALLEERRTAAVKRAVFQGVRGDALRPSGVEWIGGVPAHWRVLQLRRFAKFTTGITPPTEDEANYEAETNGRPWIRPEDLKPTGRPTVASRHLSPEGWETIRPVPAGSTLVCCIGATLGKVGIIGAPAATNQQITAVVTTSAEDRYIFHALSASHEGLRLLSTGNTLPILNNDRLASMPVPLPPRDEQREIAAYLDRSNTQIDELMARARESIALMKERRAALISAAVTGRIDVRTGIEQVERDLEEARV